MNVEDGRELNLERIPERRLKDQSSAASSLTAIFGLAISDARDARDAPDAATTSPTSGSDGFLVIRTPLHRVYI